MGVAGPEVVDVTRGVRYDLARIVVAVRGRHACGGSPVPGTISPGRGGDTVIVEDPPRVVVTEPRPWGDHRLFV